MLDGDGAQSVIEKELDTPSPPQARRNSEINTTKLSGIRNKAVQAVQAVQKLKGMTKADKADPTDQKLKGATDETKLDPIWQKATSGWSKMTTERGQLPKLYHGNDLSMPTGQYGPGMYDVKSPRIQGGRWGPPPSPSPSRRGSISGGCTPPSPRRASISCDSTPLTTPSTTPSQLRRGSMSGGSTPLPERRASISGGESPLPAKPRIRRSSLTDSAD